VIGEKGEKSMFLSDFHIYCPVHREMASEDEEAECLDSDSQQSENEEVNIL